MSETEQIDSKVIQSYLSFRLDDELFAIDVGSVVEILEVPNITRVPKAPQYMSGVINLRGSVLPLIDTKIRFGLPEVQFTVDTCVVVIDIEIDDEILKVGVLVDAVLEVMEVDVNSIKPSPSIDTKYPSNFVQGVIEKEGKFIMLLQIANVFSPSEETLIKE